MIYDLLYDWQKKIVDSFKHRDAFGLFLDMGLGKTPISLAFAEQNKCTKVIVITINAKATESESIPGSWLSWASKASIKYDFKTKKSNEFDGSRNELFLINYEALFARGKDKTKRMTLKDNVQAFINSCKGHNVALIVDESHKVKNLQSQQTMAIMQIQKRLILIAKQAYTYLLTGTPFTTGYIDLYTQLKLLGHDGTKSQFIDDFCIKGNIAGLLGWQQPIIAYKNVDLLFKLIHKYALTIKSEEVTDLPEKVFVEHISNCSQQFTMFTKEFAYPDEILAENRNTLRTQRMEDLSRYSGKAKVNNPFFRNIAYPDLKWLAETNGTFWLRARQLSIGFQGSSDEAVWYDKTRLTQLKSFLELYEDNYVLFYNYTPELIELYFICDELGYNVDVYCGEFKSLKYYEKFSKMSDSDKLTCKKNIILANFASGSTGMNWQEYNKCIIFSVPLFKDYEQGIKRIHRLGQKSTVIYHLFYQNNWLDKAMRKSLNESCQYSQDMFDADLARINKLLSSE